MKIGIITLHCSYNFGSALQAFALQQYIEDHFGETYIINFVHRKDFEQYKLFRAGLYLKQPRCLASDIVFFKKNYIRKRSFESFLQKYVRMTKKQYFSCGELEELNAVFDVFICGSDQIWNPVCFGAVEPAFFLQFVHTDKRKIAYAPSISHLSLKKQDLAQMATYINQLDAVSVREKSTISLIEAMVGKPVKSVLDPTLLLHKSQYLKIMSPCLHTGFIFVYMLEYSSELIEYAKKQSAFLGKRVVYHTFNSLWRRTKFKNAVNVYGIGPDEFLGYIYKADYIITNSFHGTIFSLVFEKKFCTFKTKYSFSRVTDLLNDVGLSERIYHDGIKWPDKIDYEAVNMKLDKMRQESELFLQEALGSE